MRRDFVFVTGNDDKLREAERILGYRPRSAKLDLPELQSLDLHEILRAKAAAAFDHFGVPVVVEDVSFELAAMNGFPGPLVKWMLQSLGAEGMAQAALALGDGRAEAICGLAYCAGDGCRVFEGCATGSLIATARGEHGFGWDPVFVPAGMERSYAELEPAEKDLLGHRGKAWRAFCAALADPV